MPGIFYQPLTRRKFLRDSAKAAAGLAWMAQARMFADNANPRKELHLALLSDTHLPADRKNEYRKFFPWENLKAVVPQVAEARPEGVIINGDAARLSGELADYEELKQLLAPLAAEKPVFIGLGNHDDRAHFGKVFDQMPGAKQPVTDKLVLVQEQDQPALRFILLDSLLYVNKVAGLLGRAQREWLSRYLGQCDDRVTLLFVHHTLGDADGDLLDAERLFRLIRPHKKVKAIFYGHSHQYAFSENQGVHLVNLPAVGYNFADSEPVGWVDAHITREGADLTLRALGGNRTGDGKTTSIAWTL